MEARGKLVSIQKVWLLHHAFFAMTDDQIIIILQAFKNFTLFDKLMPFSTIYVVKCAFNFISVIINADFS
jgi:hypothetical protein